MFEIIHSFLISMLLWHLTWGWGQIIINMWVLVFLLKCIARIPLIQSFFLSCISHACTSIFLISTVSFIFVYLLGYTFDGESQIAYLTVYTTPFRCALIFGIFYASLQSLFFIILNRYYPFKYLKRVVILTVISMIISSYIMVPFYMRMG